MAIGGDWFQVQISPLFSVYVFLVCVMLCLLHSRGIGLEWGFTLMIDGWILKDYEMEIWWIRRGREREERGYVPNIRCCFRLYFALLVVLLDKIYF